jgi:hypothetical protein
MYNFYLTDINLFAVFVSWIIHTASGLLWFQLKLFGNEWSNLTGKELKPTKRWVIPVPDRESIHWNGDLWFNPGCVAMNQ